MLPSSGINADTVASEHCPYHSGSDEGTEPLPNLSMRTQVFELAVIPLECNCVSL